MQKQLGRGWPSSVYCKQTKSSSWQDTIQTGFQAGLHLVWYNQPPWMVWGKWRLRQWQLYNTAWRPKTEVNRYNYPLTINTTPCETWVCAADSRKKTEIKDGVITTGKNFCSYHYRGLTRRGVDVGVAAAEATKNKHKYRRGQGGGGREPKKSVFTRIWIMVLVVVVVGVEA